MLDVVGRDQRMARVMVVAHDKARWIHAVNVSCFARRMGYTTCTVDRDGLVKHFVRKDRRYVDGHSCERVMVSRGLDTPRAGSIPRVW